MTHAGKRPTRLGWLVVMMTVLVSTATAIAHHGSIRSIFPTSNYQAPCQKFGVCRQDNASMSYFYGRGLSTDGRSTITSAINNWYSPTNLNPYYDSNPTYDGSAETDVIYAVAPEVVPSGKGGVSRCDDPSGTVECDQTYVSFAYNPYAALACHETGHSVGLLHGTDAAPLQDAEATEFRCMRVSAPSGSYLGDHNIHQINISY